MEMDYNRPVCPILDVDGVISGGKQFDLDITLPEDNRDVIYGVVKDCFKEPVCNAVVKLVEIVYDCGKEERRPIGHTFTDKEGEFVFGPLCPGKKYALQIWVNDTRKIKICAKCHHEGKCLRGEKHEKCDCFLEEKCRDDKKDCEKDFERKFDKDCKKDYEKKCEKDCEKCCEKECKKDYEKCYEKECKKDCDKCYEKDCKKDCDKYYEKDCR